MKIFNFKIEDRQIEALGDVVTAGDANVDQFAFSFDSEWDGLTKTVVFINGTQPILANLIDDVAQLPTQVYNAGVLTFGVYGRNESDQVVLSSLMYSFEVYEGAYDLSGNPQNLPDKTTWDEYTDIMLGLVAQGQLTLADCQAILGQVTDLKNTTKGYMDTTEGYKDTTKGYMDTTEGYKDDVALLKQQTQGIVDTFNNNATQKTTDFNNNAVQKTNDFNSNAVNKTNDFNTNAGNKTTDFNNNALNKTTDFDNNAIQKTTDFNNNAEAIMTMNERLLDQIPTGTVIGDDLNITDAADLPVKNVNVCGNTTQDGTPTPSNPVDIVDTTGTQTVTISDGTNTITKTLHLGDIHLRKIGDYQDKIYHENGKWWLGANIKNQVLNGSETGWSLDSSYNAFFRRFTDIIQLSDVPKKVLCNYFKGEYTTTAAQQWTNYPNNCIGGRGSTNLIGIKATQFTTLEDFKAWLSTHNITIQYILEAPTITEITDQTLIDELDALISMETYKDSTIIEVTASAGNPAQLEVTYRKDLQKMFDNLTNAIVSLGNNT